MNQSDYDNMTVDELKSLLRMKLQSIVEEVEKRTEVVKPDVSLKVLHTKFTPVDIDISDAFVFEGGDNE